MSIVPTAGDDGEDRDAAAQAASMKERLSKDVAAWSKERNGLAAGHASELTPPPVERALPRAAARAKKPSQVSPAAKPEGSRSKPFSMSYDGVTTSEYIQYMLDRRAR